MVCGLLIAVASLIAEHGLCMWAEGVWASVAAAHGLSSVVHTSLAALQHVEFSQTRDGTYVPFFGRWILIHCTTGKSSALFLSSNMLLGELA